MVAVSDGASDGRVVAAIVAASERVSDVRDGEVDLVGVASAAACSCCLCMRLCSVGIVLAQKPMMSRLATRPTLAFHVLGCPIRCLLSFAVCAFASFSFPIIPPIGFAFYHVPHVASLAFAYKRIHTSTQLFRGIRPAPVVALRGANADAYVFICVLNGMMLMTRLIMHAFAWWGRRWRSVPRGSPSATMEI